jgi:hypothetical protein
LVNGDLGGVGDFLEAAIILLASAEQAFAERRWSRCGTGLPAFWDPRG